MQTSRNFQKLVWIKHQRTFSRSYVTVADWEKSEGMASLDLLLTFKLNLKHYGCAFYQYLADSSNPQRKKEKSTTAVETWQTSPWLPKNSGCKFEVKFCMHSDREKVRLRTRRSILHGLNLFKSIIWFLLNEFKYLIFSLK